MHGEYNETPRLLSMGETLLVGGGQESFFVNGNFTRYISTAQGNTVVVETTYLGAQITGAGGALPMHQRLQD